MIAFRPPTVEEQWCVRMHSECIPRIFDFDHRDRRRITARFERDRQRACIACRDEHDPGDEDPAG